MFEKFKLELLLVTVGTFVLIQYAYLLRQVSLHKFPKR
jgi:hypothetical protein